jgi:hypothetical protein
VADEQRARRAEAPAQVRPPADDMPLCARTEQCLAEFVRDLGARRAGLGRGGRRLGLDERAQRVEHLGNTSGEFANEHRRGRVHSPILGLSAMGAFRR